MKSVYAIVSMVLLLSVIVPLIAQYPLTEDGKSPFVEVVRNIRESVVHIQVEAEVESQIPRGRMPFDDDFFRFFFGPMPESRRSTSMGSGFIFQRNGREVYILTNNHVIGKGENRTITVTLADKAKYRAELVGTDPMTDIAVIKIEVNPNEQVILSVLGDSNNLDIGDWAIAIGNPFGQLGLERTVTVGVISAVGRASLNLGADSPLYQDFIQTDAAINPGNSGGPLLNMKGEVIGINTAITSTGGGSIGIGFAIPINMAKKVVNDLLSEGRVVRAYLGILPQEITYDLQQSLGLERVGGVLVAKVEDDTPAAKGGLRNGDVIVEFNNIEVNNVARFRIIVADSEIGKKIPLKIIRNNKTQNISVVLSELLAEEVETVAAVSDKKDMLGVKVQDLKGEFAARQQIKADYGVVVTEIDRNSPTAKSDLRVGDVIQEVNHEKVRTVKEFNKLVANAESKHEKGENSIVLLYVQSPNSVYRYVTINLAD